MVVDSLGFMDTLTINISWEHALTIVAFLISGPAVIAWYANGRFTKLETSMEWVRETVKEIKVFVDNAGTTPAFASQSPINLTPIGEQWLTESGLRDYIDTNKDTLLSQCQSKRETNPYEVQKYVFDLFDRLQLPKDVDDRVKQYAFEKGTTMAVMRRVGGIHLRNVCLDNFGMNREDIDKHAPEVENS